MISAIVGALILTAGLSLAILSVRRLQRFCDPAPPDHCGPPWLTGVHEDCVCSIDTGIASVPTITLISRNKTSSAFHFTPRELGVGQDELVGHELQLIVESADNKFMFVSLSTDSGNGHGVWFAVDGARNSPAGRHRYYVRDADENGRVLARGEYQIKLVHLADTPDDDDPVDDCEICGASSVVSITRHDPDTGTLHAVALCDDCYHDDLAFTTGKQ